VGARRGGFQPGKEAGERLLGHRQLHLVLRGTRLGLDDDPVGRQHRALRRLGRATRGDLKRAPPEHVLGAQGHAERAVPEQLIALVRGDAEPPGTAAGRAAQAALNGAAAAL